MSVLINALDLPDNAHIFGGEEGFASFYNRGSMFCTAEGLVGTYIPYDVVGGGDNRVSLYSPSINGVALPFAEFAVPEIWIVTYSSLHRGLLGVYAGTGSAPAPVRCLDLRTGFVRDVGLVSGGYLPGYSDLQGLVAMAFDGTYMHLLDLAGGVTVWDINLDSLVRSYSAPFGDKTVSIAYDGAGAMWFGSGFSQTTHVAKVAIGTGGSQAEGTILLPARFDDYNTDTTYTGRFTLVAWTGQNLMVNRKGTAEIRRYDVRGVPSIVIISPNPAIVPADGTTESIVEVSVMDSIGVPYPGASVALVIDNTAAHIATTSLVPVLSQNVDVSGFTAAASSVDTADLAGFAAYHVFDGTSVDGWLSDTASAVNSWVSITLPIAKALGAVRLSAPNTGDMTQMPNSFSIQGSNDGFVTFTDLLDVVGESAWLAGSQRYYKITTPSATTFTSYRVFITLTNEGGGSIPASIAQFELFEYTPPTPSATAFGSILSSPKNTDINGSTLFTYRSGSLPGVDFLTATVTY